MTNDDSNKTNELKHVDFLGEPAYMIEVEGVKVMAAKGCFSMFKKLSDNQIIAKIDAMARVWTWSLKTLASQGRCLVMGFKNAKPGVMVGAPE